MEPTNNILASVNNNVFHKYVEFTYNGIKYIACAGNNMNKLYIIDATKDLATTTPFSCDVIAGIASISVLECNDTVYVFYMS